MNNKVIALEKPQEETCPAQEVEAIVRAGAEVEPLAKKPNRIVVMNKPLHNTIEGALGHKNFVATEVEYNRRWV